MGKLCEIQNEMKSDESLSYSPSLYLGRLGYILFNAVSKQFRLDDEDFEDIKKLIAEVDSESSPSYTFCGGLSGYKWLMKYLEKKGCLDLEADYFEDVDGYLFEEALARLTQGDYDFMHGGSGAIVALLLDSERNKERISLLTRKLLECQARISGKATWQYTPFEDETPEIRKVSLGLSHGIPALMVILSKVYQANNDEAEAIRTIYEIYNFISGLKVPRTNVAENSLYPSMHNEGAENSYKARLGWCYGDLSIAMALYVTGNNINDSRLVSEALDILDLYAKGGHKQWFCIVDGGFCHGAAGIAHIYNKMYLATGRKLYEECRNYWLSLIESTSHSEGLAGFLYCTGDRGWVKTADLLNGISGIGLCLSGVQHQITDWDECFLLS